MQLTSILDLWEYDAETINAPNFDPLPKINNKSIPLFNPSEFKSRSNRRSTGGSIWIGIVHQAISWEEHG